MKKFILLFIACLCIISSCKKEEANGSELLELRIRNNLLSDLEMTVGNLDYGLIINGTTTSYKAILEGPHNIIGFIQDTVLLISGSIDIKDQTVNIVFDDGVIMFMEDPIDTQVEGKKKWTLTFNNTGGAKITQD